MYKARGDGARGRGEKKTGQERERERSKRGGRPPRSAKRQAISRWKARSKPIERPRYIYTYTLSLSKYYNRSPEKIAFALHARWFMDEGRNVGLFRSSSSLLFFLLSLSFFFSSPSFFPSARSFLPYLPPTAERAALSLFRVSSRFYWKAMEMIRSRLREYI